MDEVELTFNPDSFIQGINKITAAMNGFENKTKEKGEKVNKTTEGMSSFMVAKGTIIANMMMGAFNKAFNFIKTGLPEIGQSMSIASGIIQRNLLGPLRKEMAPMLQSMLNWVRDHRAMFVRWGGTLVNIFRAVVVVIKGFINMGKALIAPIAEKMKSLFGGVAGGISDVFNIVLFKITAVVMFLQVEFTPLITKIGALIAWTIGLASEFFQGFSDGISGITGPLMDLLNQLQSLLDLLTLSDGQTNILYVTFKALGDFIGTVLYTAISALAQVIDSLVFAIERIVDGVKWAKAALTGTSEEADAIARRIVERDKAFTERAKQRGSDIIDKWIGYDDKRQSTFSPSSAISSKQQIYATSKVNIERMEIKVAQGEDPKKAGESFIEGMNKKNSQNFRNILLNEAGAQGY